MKTISIYLIIFFSSLYISHAGIILVEGKYQNKNIYVQNAYTSFGVGYCVYAIYVNNKLTNDEINSTAFEIDLEQLQLKYGQDIDIKIFHKDGCAPPRILNPDALKPIPSFEIVTMNMSNNGLITWKVKNESGPLPYFIEQFRWNKWVYVGEVQGVGTPEEHNYSFQVSAFHSGENKFRVKQVGYRTKVSYEVKIISGTPLCIFSVLKNKTINFSRETLYEIYNFYGSIIKKGYGTRIDITTLQKGGYYICYDNSIAEVKKK
ncbi:MAG: hypothetical protein V1781_07270 [Bacteroidota bacterium]